jgi:hypothetical protein
MSGAIPRHVRFEQQPAIAAILIASAGALRKASEVEEELDSVNQLIRELFIELGLSPTWVAPAQPQSRPHNRKTENQVQTRKAQPNVNSLSLVFLPNGRAHLQIEGRQKIVLAPRLAALVAALTVDDRPSPDHLVAWKSKEDIIADLQRRTGKQFNQHDLKNLMYLLRQELKAHQENPDLVMHHRKLGSRFGLQRGGKVFVTSDSHK